MEFEDHAFILSARVFGETGAIVEALTSAHGKYAAHVSGGASRRMTPSLQLGSRVILRYRARLSDQLGSASVEAIGQGASALFDDPLALAALAAATAVAGGALPEREPYDGVFLAFESLAAALANPEIWPAVFVRFEAGLLGALGFGLDLSRCAVTGATEGLVYVSPRTGRAVSAGAGGPYGDRLLALPAFLLSAQGRLAKGDIAAGLRLTGHFLETCVFAALNRTLPPARLRLLDRLADADIS